MTHGKREWLIPVSIYCMHFLQYFEVIVSSAVLVYSGGECNYVNCVRCIAAFDSISMCGCVVCVRVCGEKRWNEWQGVAMLVTHVETFWCCYLSECICFGWDRLCNNDCISLNKYCRDLTEYLQGMPLHNVLLTKFSVSTVNIGSQLNSPVLHIQFAHTRTHARSLSSPHTHIWPITRGVLAV